MKYCYTLLLFTALHATGQPSKKVTITVQNATLRDVLTRIKVQTGYSYIGKEEYFRLAHPVTLFIQNVPLEVALDACFHNQPVTYECNRKTITVKLRPITGRVIAEKGAPLERTTIIDAAGKDTTMADDQGYFSLYSDSINTTLEVSYACMITRMIHVTGRDSLTIVLQAKISKNEENTASCTVTHRLSTGKVSTIDNDELIRGTGINILNRLYGIAPGLIENKNIRPGSNQSIVSIRGRNTLFGNPDPLIVVDNFPYFGDIRNINLHDVDTVIILKEADALSMWGTRAGNGVIYVTTKKGKYYMHPRITVLCNATFTNKPDIYYPPVLGPASYIEAEQFLFNKGFYKSYENDPSHPALSPVVETLIKKRDGQMPAQQADALLNSWAKHSALSDEHGIFYRPGLHEQYFVNITGGSGNAKYYASAGSDELTNNTARSSYSRRSFNFYNTYELSDEIELMGGLSFGASTDKNVDILPVVPYPYSYVPGFINEKAGNTPYLLRTAYTDTAGSGLLSDWTYNTANELYNRSNYKKVYDIRFNASLKIPLLWGIVCNLAYQYQYNNAQETDNKNRESFYVRNLVNSYAQQQGGAVLNPISPGDIIDHAAHTLDATFFRSQFLYARKRLSYTAGADINQVKTSQLINRMYGYHNGQWDYKIDYQALFPMYYNPAIRATIPYLGGMTAGNNQYISGFGSVHYNYSEKLNASFNMRYDGAGGWLNNHNGHAMYYAMGAGWNIDREPFLTGQKWLSLLKLRVTAGFFGNSDQTITSYSWSALNRIEQTGIGIATLSNLPANLPLQERTFMGSAALEFALKNKRLIGSVECYIKNGQNLLSANPFDTTLTLTDLTSHHARMRGNGMDVNLTTINPIGNCKLKAQLLMSYVTNTITEYNGPRKPNSVYTDPGNLIPLQGYPLYSIFSLKWAGLDGQTGDPIGTMNNAPSKNYAAINASVSPGDLQYNGPATPVLFGSLRNELTWRNLSLSFVISWKLKYFFRRSSINYTDLFHGGAGHPDYDLRWKKPGDEKYTNVPSMAYPADPERDVFFTFSNILVEKGDHIRFQDCQFSYELPRRENRKYTLQKARVYVYANNIGLLWKANRQGIDPDYLYGLKPPFSLAVGTKLEL